MITETIRYDFAETSIAALAIALSDVGVVAIAMRERMDEGDLEAELTRRFRGADLVRDRSALVDARKRVVDFVERPVANIDLPLDIRGTEFQRKAWAAVLDVPFGQTTSFAAVAERAGSPKAVRAVGSACTRNPLEFAIPCHRVLRSDGSWSGGSDWGNRRQATLVGRKRAASEST